MTHRATGRFWQRYEQLPGEARKQADSAFSMLRKNPRHPSLRLKKIGAFWSVRVGAAYRALAVEDGDDFVWVWIGSHGEYDRVIKRRK